MMVDAREVEEAALPWVLTFTSRSAFGSETSHEVGSMFGLAEWIGYAGRW